MSFYIKFFDIEFYLKLYIIVISFYMKWFLLYYIMYYQKKLYTIIEIEINVFAMNMIEKTRINWNII